VYRPEAFPKGGWGNCPKESDQHFLGNYMITFIYELMYQQNTQDCFATAIFISNGNRKGIVREGK